jgi:putative copper export protein
MTAATIEPRVLLRSEQTGGELGVVEWLMFAHLLAAMIWLGGWATLSVLAARALREKPAS